MSENEKITCRLSNDLKTSVDDLEMILNAIPDSSDIFIQTGQPVKAMVSKRIVPLMDRPLNESEVRSILTHIGDNQTGLYDNAMSGGEPLDASYVSKKGQRFRVGMIRDASRKGLNLSVVMRRIESKPWPLEKLRLPKGLLDISRSRKPGLILINGPTGSGKTSLLSGLLNDIVTGIDANAHLYTVESPVEYIYYEDASDSSMVTQAEVGTKSCKTFASGVRNAMRMRPTHILIGEIRDAETARAAIAAARSGHTVYATMHTSSVPEIFSRWTDFFTDNPKLAIAELGSSILYAAYQTLERMPDGRLMPIQEHLNFESIGDRGVFVESLSQRTESVYTFVAEQVKQYGLSHQDDWAAMKKKYSPEKELLNALGKESKKSVSAMDYLATL